MYNMQPVSCVSSSSSLLSSKTVQYTTVTLWMLWQEWRWLYSFALLNNQTVDYHR